MKRKEAGGEQPDLVRRWPPWPPPLPPLLRLAAWREKEQGENEPRVKGEDAGAWF
jgi:hypothetical protein